MERGSNLSAGERQLLAFARVLAFDPDILILDEATASVDTGTEKLIQEALERLMANRTSFVIAHRLSTVLGADHIFVIANGELVQQGNYQTLAAQPGLFADLVRRQQTEGTPAA